MYSTSTPGPTSTRRGCLCHDWVGPRQLRTRRFQQTERGTKNATSGLARRWRPGSLAAVGGVRGRHQRQQSIVCGADPRLLSSPRRLRQPRRRLRRRLAQHHYCCLRDADICGHRPAVGSERRPVPRHLLPQVPRCARVQTPDLDSDWIVCTQNIAPGQQVTSEVEARSTRRGQAFGDLFRRAGPMSGLTRSLGQVQPQRHKRVVGLCGGAGGARTHDPGIMSPML